MSRTPYGLAMAIIGKKEGKTKKCHARYLVWPCLPKGRNFKEKQIIFNLSYYTNITITVTFVNQPTLCRTFFLFPPNNYLHKSRVIFHINLYVLSIHTEVPDSTTKLNHMKQSAIFQNKPFAFPDSRMNHLCRYWNKRILTIIQYTFCNRHAQWLPLINERFIINKLVTVSIVFFGLGVTNDAAKPDCILPTGDNAVSNEGCSSGKLIVIEINEALLSRKQQSCQKCKHRQSHFDFPNTASKKNST
jgi:hypothetical protein